MSQRNCTDAQLKTCPFCLLTKCSIRATPDAFFVICKGCEAQGPACSLPSLAMDAWNAWVMPAKEVDRRRRKLTYNAVREIKAKLNDTQSSVTHKALADAYGVSRETITKIASGDNWSHVN